MLTAITLNNRSKLYYSSGDYPKSEPLNRCAIEIFTHQGRNGDPTFAWLLNNLALLYAAQARYTEARPLYEQASAIYESIPPPPPPRATTARKNHAEMLEKMRTAQKWQSSSAPIDLKLAKTGVASTAVHMLAAIFGPSTRSGFVQRKFACDQLLPLTSCGNGNHSPIARSRKAVSAGNGRPGWPGRAPRA